MQKWLLIIVACLVFGLSLLAHLPAKLVFPKSSGNFQFVGIGGSVWQGEIKQILLSGKPLPVRNLNWSVKPLALITGTLKAAFYEQQTVENRGIMDFNLLSRQLELNALHWQLPTGSLEPWNSWQGMKAQGRLVVDLQTLQLPANGLFPGQLKGQLDWQNAALQTDSETLRIGSPLIQFSGANDTINGTVSNSQPMLPGNGSFQCTVNGCQLTLNLQPSPDAPQSILNSLMFLGLQQSGNQFSGQINLPLE